MYLEQVNDLVKTTLYKLNCRYDDEVCYLPTVK
jgi:hypothetical protein